MRIITLFLLLLSQLTYAQKIKGTVKDASTKEALFNAIVKIKGTTLGAVTNIDGQFEFETTFQLPITLSISYVGYTAIDYTVSSFDKPVQITIKKNETLLKAVDVVADRITEKQKESPLTIE